MRFVMVNICDDKKCLCGCSIILDTHIFFSKFFRDLPAKMVLS